MFCDVGSEANSPKVKLSMAKSGVPSTARLHRDQPRPGSDIMLFFISLAYRVKFIVSFQNSNHKPPHDLVFSVGKPFDKTTFANRFVDANITPDVVPVLLHPDAVRVRVGRRRYNENKGKGWLEIEGDIEVSVGLDGALGFVVSKRYEEEHYVDGWSFGGVRLEPIFGKEGDLMTQSLI